MTLCPHCGQPLLVGASYLTPRELDRLMELWQLPWTEERYGEAQMLLSRLRAAPGRMDVEHAYVDGFQAGVAFDELPSEKRLSEYAATYARMTGWHFPDEEPAA